MNKNRHSSLVIVVLSSLGLGTAVPACAVALDAVAASCSAGAIAVAGLRSVVGQLNNAINDAPASGQCSGGPTVAPAPGTSAAQVQLCFSGAKCSMVEVCESDSADTACNTCAKSSCCDAAAAFAVDPLAPCLVGCQEGASDAGTSIEACSALCGGGPDKAYDDLASCLAGKCESECKSLVSVLQ
jgi:hypothetical protein